MKTVRGRIPLAGFYSFNITVNDDMTEKEIFKKLEDDFNASSSNTNLYAAMMTGTIANFPLSFAVIDEVL